MNEKIVEIAQRITGMRELLGISIEDMCFALSVSEQEYRDYESGKRDFSFSFLYQVALKFGIDITELITGDMPRLSRFSLIRAGQGLPIERRKGFAYQHMAYLMKNRNIEPFRVIAKYDKSLEEKPISISSHAGHEFDYVLSGRLKVQIEDHIMELGPGDAVYYDAKNRHGMIAVGGEDCVFLAVISSTGEEKNLKYEQA
jgi:mannose-6-phosphate isomerase-like protein (cupin superfamily)